MARFARWRASRWVGVAVCGASRPEPRRATFLLSRGGRFLRVSEKSPGGVLATAGYLFACSFSSPQNANLAVQAPVPYLFSANANLAAGAPKSFFYIANSNLAVEAPKLLFSSLQNTNLTVGAPKSPLHNSANAVMRMVVFLFQRA